jgi:hypothetical protein
MTIQLKLFLFEKRNVPEWGHSSLEYQHYILAEDEDKAKAYIQDKYKVGLDCNGKCSKYFSCDRCEDVYTLKELECAIV